MISAVSWVPKGASKAVPEVAEPPSKEEIEELLRNGVLRSGDGDSDEDEEEMDLDNSKKVDEVSQALAVADALGRTSKTANDKAEFDEIADGLRELNMENYNEEDEDIELFSTGLGDLYYPSNEMDPYLKHDDEDDDSEELDDIAIRPMDSLIVCARTDDEVNLLEIYLLEQSDDGEMNIFVHHELVLSDFPLCTAWLDCPLKGGDKGNFIAVGSMGPAIEIWDLDTIDAVEPCCVLGGAEVKKKKKKKKEKKASIKYKDGSHTGSVLGIAWNKEFRNIIASAGGDNRVKIWDVAAGKCNITMEHHTDKVQAVAWNHHAPQVLLSGSFDHSVIMKDGRIPTHSGYKWAVITDVESLEWDPHSEHSFVVSLEDGTIKGFDVRAAASNSSAETKPSFTLHAHDKAVSTLSYNPLVPNLLATGSLDKTVKIWDLTNNRPSCVVSRNPRAGAVFSISFSEDSPFMLAIGGSKGRMELWDTWSEVAVSQKYGSYCQSTSTKVPAS